MKKWNIYFLLTMKSLKTLRTYSISNICKHIKLHTNIMKFIGSYKKGSLKSFHHKEVEHLFKCVFKAVELFFLCLLY